MNDESCGSRAKCQGCSEGVALPGFLRTLLFGFPSAFGVRSSGFLRDSSFFRHLAFVVRHSFVLRHLCLHLLPLPAYWFRCERSLTAAPVSSASSSTRWR